MKSGIIVFTLGIVLLQFQAVLPDLMLLIPAAGLALLLHGLRLGRGGGLIAAFVFGFAWAGILAHWRLADALPEISEGQNMEVRGVVSALPQRFENGWRFDFDVEQSSLPAPRHISLAWYQSPLIDDDEVAGRFRKHAGERWEFTGGL